MANVDYTSGILQDAEWTPDGGGLAIVHDVEVMEITQDIAEEELGSLASDFPRALILGRTVKRYVVRTWNITAMESFIKGEYGQFEYIMRAQGDLVADKNVSIRAVVSRPPILEAPSPRETAARYEVTLLAVSPDGSSDPVTIT